MRAEAAERTEARYLWDAGEREREKGERKGKREAARMRERERGGISLPRVDNATKSGFLWNPLFLLHGP